MNGTQLLIVAGFSLVSALLGRIGKKKQQTEQKKPDTSAK